MAGTEPFTYDFLTQPQPPAAPPRGMVAPPSTGPTGALGYLAAPVAGFYETGSQLGSAVQAGAQLLGANDVAKSAADFAQRQRETAATYQNPDAEKYAWYDPRGIAYQVLKGAPAAAGMLAAGALTGGAAGAGLLGAAATRAGRGVVGGLAAGALGYPLAVGGNVQTQEAYSGDLTDHQAAKAALLGVPEAVLGALPYAGAASRFAQGAEGSLLHSITHQATSQALAGAGQDFIAQQMGDPDRPIKQRMGEMLSSVLTGGVTGGLMGAGVHVMSPMRATAVIDPSKLGSEQLSAATDSVLQLPPPAIRGKPPLQDMTPEQLLARHANVAATDPNEAMRVAQEMMRRAGPSAPDADAERPLVIPQPDTSEGVGLVSEPPIEHAPSFGDMDVPNVVYRDNEAPEPPADMARSIPEPGAPQEAVIPQPDTSEGVGLVSEPPIEHAPSFGDTDTPNVVYPDREETVLPERSAEPTPKAGHPLANATPGKIAEALNEGKAPSKARWLDLSETPDRSAYESAVASVKQEAIRQTENNGPLRNGTRNAADVLGIPLDEKGRPISDKATELEHPATAAVDALHADPAVQANPDLAAKVEAVADNIKMPQSALDVIAKLRASTQPEPVQKSLAGLTAMTDVAAPGLKPKMAEKINKQWQDSLAADPTGANLWDNIKDTKLSPEANAALEAHVNVVEGAKQNPSNLFARPAGVPAVEGPRTANDIGITGIVNAGGSTKDVLSFLRDSSPDPANRVVAAKLLGKGVDAPIKFSTPDEMGGARNLQEGESPAAAYDYYPDGTKDQIHLGAGAGLEESVLHEAVHAGSSRALDAGGPAAKDFISLFNAARDALSGDSAIPSSDGAPANVWRDPHEFMAEMYANPQVREWARNQPTVYDGKPTTLWDRFKSTVAKMLGFDGGAKNLLDQVIERGDRVIAENQNARGAGGVFAKPRTIDPKTPAGQSQGVRDFMSAAEGSKAKIEEIATASGPAAHKAVLGMRSPQEISAGIADRAPSARRLTDAQHTEGNQKNSWNKLAAVPHSAYMALSGAGRARHDLIASATVHGIDPRKPVDKQSPDLYKADNAADLRRAAGEAYRTYNSMSDAERDAFNKRVDENAATKLAGTVMALDRIVKTQYPQITKGFEADPAAGFQMDARAHDDPAVAKQRMLDELNKRAAGISEAADADRMKLGVTKDRLGELREIAGRKPVKGEADLQRVAAVDALAKLDKPTLARLDALDRLTATADGAVKALDGVPFFHAGRSGDYYAAGAIASDKTGLPDAQAVDKLRAALAAEKFDNVVIDRSNANRDIYIKVDSQAKAQRLQDLFHSLQGSGVLDAEKQISAGPAEQAVQHGVGPAVMQDMVATLRASRPELPEGMDAAAKQQFEDAWERQLSNLTRDYMDLLSDSSPMKINARRKDVQAFAAEMGKSARQRDAAVSSMLARIGVAPEKGAAIAGLRDELKALKNTAASTAEKKIVQDAVTELMMREARRPTTEPNGAVTAMTWISRASEIGFNPAYFVTLHAQDWTYSIPELGKTHGMIAAAREIARAELPSIKVMRAMTKDPDWSFAGMRYSTLVDNGIKPEVAQNLVDLDNMGAMTHGALTQSMFSEEGDGLRSKVANISTAMGRYAEVQPRIKMAMAAKALWRGEAKDGPLLDFQAKKIKGSQFDYSSENTPRQLTRMGAAGDFSPLINQFMSYRVKATEKLFHEFHELFGGDTPADKLQAGKFLLAHLAATTVISGAMGLPMVAVFASVYDKVADALTGSPNHDIMGSFRHYLTSVYGHTAGTAIARGVPTLAGLDLSRLGDQKIAPGSDMVMMLTEKRKFQDAEKDWLKNLAGSAVGLAGNTVLGLNDIANGDYLNGAIKIVPEAFRGPTEAVRDMLYGYRNKGGTPLGITPSGVDLALTAMGLEPAQLAGYNLDKSVLLGLQTRRQIQSQNIISHAAKAVQTQNPRDLQYWAGQSAQAQQDFPGFRPPMASLGRYLQEQMRQSAIAQATGSPLGIRPNDMAARGMLGGP